MEKKAVLTQLESQVRARDRKAKREREKELMQEGIASQIKVPYTQGGQKALGVAFAEQQLMAAAIREPQMLEKIAQRVTPEQFIAPEMAEVYRLLLQKHAQGDAIELSQLSGELPESTIALLSRILAQNYDVGFTEQDVDLYLERLEDSVPKSLEAAQMSGEQLEDYLKKLREKRR